MPPPTLHLYSIFTAALEGRHARFEATLQAFRDAAQQAGYEIRAVQQVTGPDPSKIRESLGAFKDRIKYEATGIVELDREIKPHVPLTLEHLSNFEKHREAWRHIVQTAQAAPSPKDLFVVLEDDAMVFPAFVKNLHALFALLAGAAGQAVPLLFLGMHPPQPPDANAPLQILPLETAGRMPVLPCKEAYFLTPATAADLLRHTEHICAPLRLQLSHILHQNKGTAFVPSARITLDASKLCLYPSSLHPNNMPIFNREYMHFYSMLTREVPATLAEVAAFYKSKLEALHNPDAMHLYGLHLLRHNKLPEAEIVLRAAVTETKKQHGCVSNRSDLLNNLIHLYGRLQPDYDACVKNRSKYAPPEDTATPALGL